METVVSLKNKHDPDEENCKEHYNGMEDTIRKSPSDITG